MKRDVSIAIIVLACAACASHGARDAATDSGVADAPSGVDASVGGDAAVSDASSDRDGVRDSDAASPPADAGSPDADGASGKVLDGIQNLALVWTDTNTIDTRLDQLATDVPNVPWLRADIQDDSAADEANYVEIVKKAHEHGMKVLVLVSTTAGDVGGGTFPYALSKVDPTTFATRLQHYISALQAAGETPEAWEIGNELDSTGFNADDPSDVALFQQAYGAFLQTALDTIKSPANYPNAAVVTVGFANELTFNPSGHLPNPPAALAGLHAFNGQDLLARVDGYGMHVYPSPDQLQSWSETIFEQYEGAGLTDKPIYVTEWGFHRAAFPYQGMTRAQADEAWLEYVNAYSGLRFAAAILYDYHQETDMGGAQDYDIFDGGALRQDEALVISGWN